MEIDECVHSNYQISNKAHMRLFLLHPYVIVLIKIFSLTLLKYIWQHCVSLRCIWWFDISSVQFSRSVISNTLQPHGLQHARAPFHHQLLELAQTHVHWVCDAIQPSHPLSFPSPPTFNLSQHHDLIYVYMCVCVCVCVCVWNEMISTTVTEHSDTSHSSVCAHDETMLPSHLCH